MRKTTLLQDASEGDIQVLVQLFMWLEEEWDEESNDYVKHGFFKLQCKFIYGILIETLH